MRDAQEHTICQRIGSCLKGMESDWNITRVMGIGRAESIGNNIGTVLQQEKRGRSV